MKMQTQQALLQVRLRIETNNRFVLDPVVICLWFDKQQPIARRSTRARPPRRIRRFRPSDRCSRFPLVRRLIVLFALKFCVFLKRRSCLRVVCIDEFVSFVCARFAEAIIVPGIFGSAKISPRFVYLTNVPSPPAGAPVFLFFVRFECSAV